MVEVKLQNIPHALLKNGGGRIAKSKSGRIELSTHIKIISTSKSYYSKMRHEWKTLPQAFIHREYFPAGWTVLCWRPGAVLHEFSVCGLNSPRTARSCTITRPIRPSL
ncbi:hypothetical protein Trydic_g7002 [Trypoxylus dichotomus]